MTRCPRCQRRLPADGSCPVHGISTGSVVLADLEPAHVVAPPGWQLGAQLAMGGMSLVFTVQRSGGAAAILKWGRWRARDIHARFAAEADVLRAVGPPWTPAYVEHGAIDDWPYLIMEHVPGETLAAWMSRSGERGGLGEIIALLTRLSAAVEGLHAAGYVHRDLKPENAINTPRTVRLLDLGLARPLVSAAPALTQVGHTVGTVHYAAPEQLRVGGVVDQRADLYSLGVIAFEMLTGVPPFVGERGAIEYQHQVCRPPSVRELRPVPPALDELIQACLAKQPEARPRSAAALRDGFSDVLGVMGTLPGLGVSAEPRSLGRQGRVALAWIIGGDPVEVSRAVTGVRGTIVRGRGDGVLAAFSSVDHEDPLDVALEVCRDLARPPCRIVVHLSSALVRRTAHGKSTFYGAELEQIPTWTPAEPFTGLLLSAAAADGVARAAPADDHPGFFRDRKLYTDATDLVEASLVGRDRLIEDVVAALSTAPGLVGISGHQGAGKTSVAEAIAERLRASGAEVISLGVRRRLDGDRPDDDRLLAALGDAHDPHDALVGAGARGLILVIDDADRLSTPLLDELRRPDLACARLVTSLAPLFEAEEHAPERLAIELPPLSLRDAAVLLREQLRPARLVPDVLIDRLALRGVGNPGLLVALARDLKRRGAVRRQDGGDEWYVAPDELDTLLAPPGPAWLAVRALEDLPPELADVARACSALGPRFAADEVAAVTGLDDVAPRLDGLVRHGVLVIRGGGHEFVDAALQDAIYEHVLDERDVIHARAFAYWLAPRGANLVGRLARLAHHGASAGEPSTAATCWLALARERLRHGEADQADRLIGRALAYNPGDVDPAVLEAVRAIEPS